MALLKRVLSGSGFPLYLSRAEFISASQKDVALILNACKPMLKLRFTKAKLLKSLFNLTFHITLVQYLYHSH